MVDVSLIQPVSQVAAAIGVLIAAIYYVLNLRNTRKTHELQVFMQVFDRFNNKDFWNELDEMMKRQWTSVEDYEKKYSSSAGNVVFPTLEGLGVLLKRSLIDASVPWDLFGNYLFHFWSKYEVIILERRKVIGSDYSLWTEYLVNEVKGYAVKHHESMMLPESK